MVQKKEKNTVKSECDCVKYQPFIVYKISEFQIRACFGDPMSLPFCTSLFSCTLTHSAGRSGYSAGESEEKQSSVTLPVLVTEA